jgi:hypothetical protein
LEKEAVVKPSEPVEDLDQIKEGEIVVGDKVVKYSYL